MVWGVEQIWKKIVLPSSVKPKTLRVQQFVVYEKQGFKRGSVAL